MSIPNNMRRQTGGGSTQVIGVEGPAGPAGPSYTHPNHSGDVASVGDGATTISSNVVTNSKLADMPASTLKGNNTGALADPVDLTPTDVKTLLALGNVDNTSDANKPVSTAQAAADTATLNTAKSYADSLVVGLLDDRGNFDASANVFPSSGGSGASGAIKKGDLWTISVAGTLPGGQAVTAGDIVRALVDSPGSTVGNWAVSETNIGYTPVVANGPIAPATKTKVTYDAKGLVTTGADAALDDMSDVVIGSPTAGQVLKYDGTNWINGTDSTGGGGVVIGTGVLDFGDSGDYAQVTISNGAVTATSKILLSSCFLPSMSLGRDVEETIIDPISMVAVPATGSLTVHGAAINGNVCGMYGFSYTAA